MGVNGRGEVHLTVSNLHLDFTVYSLRAQSIRTAVMNAAVGGRLLKDRNDQVTVRALKDVSFSLRAGDRLGIMGHNGSGKTTLLKVLAGIYPPTHGRVDASGTVSSLIDIGHGLDLESNAIDNIRVLGALRLIPLKHMDALVPEILDFADLGPYAYLPVKTYSAGMQLRLLFAVATSFYPDILILDEWLGAGDAGFMAKAATRMGQVVENAKIIVLASHAPDLIHQNCNKLLVLDHGAIAYLGDADAYFSRGPEAVSAAPAATAA